MNAQDRNGENVLPITSQAEGDDDLPYEIVLAPASSEGRERLLARAASGQLAHAIFGAAKSEHPDARIILRRGTRVIADSSGERTR